jgi:hypothetical protein
LHNKLIRHLVLLAEVTFSTSCYEILRIICAAFGYWDDVIHGVGFHAAPIAFSPISVEDTKP